MGRKSAGILVFRKTKNLYEVLLAHPGGPFWAKKDLNSWSVPKGEYDDAEDAFAAAKREFTEETGFKADGEFFKLDPVKQPGGKIVSVWAVEGDFDAALLESNLFSLEWPVKSGKFREFPEIDRAEWFDFESARHKILKGQIPILDNLENLLNSSHSSSL
jgi:predicted NUDIX family NTP pyrophosphohydrolase